MSELFEAYSGTFGADEGTQDSMSEPATPADTNPSSVPSNVDDLDQNLPSSPDTPTDKCQYGQDSGYPGWLPPLEYVPLFKYFL